MPAVELPVPLGPEPVCDDHAWAFPNGNGNLMHIRMRAWATKDGGHLVLGTDYMLGGGLINMAEAFYNATVREFGTHVTVVRHFPAWTMTAGPADKFQRLDLDDAGTAQARDCTDEILSLLGPAVQGFPGAPGVVVGPQSTQMGLLHSALIRLDQVHGTVVAKDLDPASQMALSTAALERLTKYIAAIIVDDETKEGAKRERELERVVEALQKQATELMLLGDQVRHRDR